MTLSQLYQPLGSVFNEILFNAYYYPWDSATVLLFWSTMTWNPSGCSLDSQSMPVTGLCSSPLQIPLSHYLDHEPLMAENTMGAGCQEPGTSALSRLSLSPHLCPLALLALLFWASPACVVVPRLPISPPTPAPSESPLPLPYP